MTVSEREIFVDIPTSAGLARWKVSVDLMNDDTVLAGNIFQFADKLAMRKVRHLPSPELRHACEAKILDEDSVVLTAQSVCDFPLPGITSVDNALILSVQILATLLSMMGVLLAHAEFAPLLPKGRKVSLQEAGTLDGGTITHRHVGLQAEVNTDGCTIMCLSVGPANGISGDDEVVFTQRTALELDRLHLSQVRPGQ